MPSSGAVIGRVSVRVLPDTTEFRRKLRDELNQIERSLKGLKVTVHIDVDTAGLRQSLGKAKAIIDRWKADNNPIKMRISVDHTFLETRLKSAKRKIDDWKRNNEPVNIKVELNVPTGSLTYMGARLAFLTRPRTVTIIPRLSESAVAGVASALAALSGARVMGDFLENVWNIGKEFDRMLPKIGLVGMAVGGIASWALSAVSNVAALSVSFAQIATAGLALPGLFAGAGIALGVLVVALTKMKDFAPQVLDSFKGLADLIGKRFWDEAASGVGRLLNQNMKPLGETASQLGKLIGGIADAMSTTFKDAVPKMFANLNEGLATLAGKGELFASVITRLGTAGSQYLPRLADAIVNVTQQFDDFLKRTSEDGTLKQFIESGIQGFKDLWRIIKNVALIIGDIGKAAALAGGSTLGIFADTMERIRDVTSSAAFQSTLTSVFQTAHTIMAAIADKTGPALVKLFGALGDTFVKIGPAISDGIGTAISAIADALADPLLQKGIQDVFYALADAIKVLAPLMAPVARTLASLAPVVTTLLGVIVNLVAGALEPLTEIIQTLAPAIVPLIEMLGTALLSAVEMLAPYLVTLAESFADMLPSILPLVDALLKLALEAFAPLVDTMIELMPLMAPLAAEVFPVLADAVIQLTPSLVELVAAFAELMTYITPAVVAIVDGLIPAFQLLLEIVIVTMQGIMNGVSNVFKGITAQFEGWSTMFSGGWSNFWEGIGQILKGAWDIIIGFAEIGLNIGLGGVLKKGMSLLKGLWDEGWEVIKAAASFVWRTISTNFDNFLSDLKNAPMMPMSALKRFFSTTWDEIKTTFATAWRIIKEEFGEALASIKGKAVSGWNEVKGATEDAWTLIKSAVSDGIDAVLDLLGGLAGRCAAAVGNLSSTLVSAGSELIGGFISGIRSRIGEVMSTLSGLTSKLPDWKGPATKDAKLLYDAGRLVIGGFITGMESQYDAVRDSLSDLSGDIGGTRLASPGGGLAGLIDGSLDYGNRGGVQKVLNYYAASGSSLGSAEDLFTAAGRARMVGW